MFSTLPDIYSEWIAWEHYEPYYQDLLTRRLDADNWLRDWTRLRRTWHEVRQRLWVATTINTADAAAEQRHSQFLDHTYPQILAAEQQVKEKLLASGVEPPGFRVSLRNLRTEARLFSAENLPLLSEEEKLKNEYDSIVGAQTVLWEGQELTPVQLSRLYHHPDRSIRERAWMLAAARWLEDRQAINDLWKRNLDLRRRIADNAGQPDYRAYMWHKLLRFDYSPQDCQTFHEAIEQVVVPAASQIYEKRRRRLGVKTLRPWDLEVDPFGQPPLQPFKTSTKLEETTAIIFRQVDPALGEYFETMRREGLLDLENRKNKAPGAYCTDFPISRRPFIFANAVGMHDDVQTLLHEGGHAFHVFESADLPYGWHIQTPMEFLEVASMGMELLAAPYLEQERGGFYTRQEAARARIETLERMLLFWPYMAVVDGFQHWVYTNPDAAQDADNCDATWAEIWRRFMPGVDWSDLEQELCTGWQRKSHIHQDPFYYVEYGMAQLGAVQIWRNSLSDQAGAVAAYRRALALGDTVTLPELYAAAGARFAFDARTLQQAVKLMLSVISALEETVKSSR